MKDSLKQHEIQPNFALVLHPSVLQLRLECETLRKELAKLIVEREFLQKTVLPRLAAEFQLKLGSLEYEAFMLEVETRELKRRIELLQSARNRNEKVSLKKIEKQIRREFAEWRERVAEMAEEYKSAKEYSEIPTLSAEATKELQTLYRRLARQLHPDVASVVTERTNALWLQVSEAYTRGDLEELRALNLLVESSSNELMPERDSSLDALRKQKLQLQEQLHRILRLLSAIKESPEYRIRELLEDDEYIEHHKSELRRKIEWLSEYKRELEKLWHELRQTCPKQKKENDEIESETIEEDWPDVIFVE